MTDGRTDRRMDGGDCNIPDAFLKKRGDNKTYDNALLCGCYHVLPLRAVSWSAVCDCGSSWSYSHFKLTFSIQFLKVMGQEQQIFL